ncbi:uncharacterized protein LOC121808757 [Salvia splendens]|uniref:uncharacterized protein LOC121808757 n=1 Tax=Salvia splendens TaxID=180675 RepID=UPI001C270605|nr:uncharacterized protein LOC121808757 [Salvia splendens]
MQKIKEFPNITLFIFTITTPPSTAAGELGRHQHLRHNSSITGCTGLCLWPRWHRLLPHPARGRLLCPDQPPPPRLLPEESNPQQLQLCWLSRYNKHSSKLCDMPLAHCPSLSTSSSVLNTSSSIGTHVFGAGPVPPSPTAAALPNSCIHVLQLLALLLSVLPN